MIVVGVVFVPSLVIVIVVIICIFVDFFVVKGIIVVLVGFDIVIFDFVRGEIQVVVFCFEHLSPFSSSCL